MPYAFKDKSKKLLRPSRVLFAEMSNVTEGVMLSSYSIRKVETSIALADEQYYNNLRRGSKEKDNDY